jgi:hypothetical protein
MYPMLGHLETSGWPHPHRAEFSPLPSRTGETFLVEGRPVFFDVISQLGH